MESNEPCNASDRTAPGRMPPEPDTFVRGSGGLYRVLLSKVVGLRKAEPYRRGQQGVLRP